MKEYLALVNRIIEDGEWVANKRTGKRCLTIINADMVYDMSTQRLPILTTKYVNYTAAIAEFLGYLKGYDNAAQFRDLGCKTWDANANETEAWLANPHRKGVDDMGRVYGVQMRSWQPPTPSGYYVAEQQPAPIDQLQLVYDKLLAGIDDRCLIIQMLNPGERDRGCLNACIHTHHFSLLNGVLHLTSYQRSDDIPLGHAFNQVQLGMFLLLMAQITGHKPGKVFHKIVNAHIYEDQLKPLVDIQMQRQPKPLPFMFVNDDIQTLWDVTEWATPEHFMVECYEHHPSIKFPFAK